MSQNTMISGSTEFVLQMAITIAKNGYHCHEKWSSLSLRHLKIKENNKYCQLCHDYKLYNKVWYCNLNEVYSSLPSRYRYQLYLHHILLSRPRDLPFVKCSVLHAFNEILMVQTELLTGSNQLMPKRRQYIVTFIVELTTKKVLNESSKLIKL